MRIVVLGAGGKLGRLLRPVFPGQACWLTRADADIQDAGALRTALRGADAVICMAGVTHTSAQPMHLNTDLALRTLDAARDTGAGHVFLVSSASVYGSFPGLCVEGGPTAPASDYAHAKLAMEAAAARHAHPNTVLRLGNVAGADAILAGWSPGFQIDQFPDGTTPRRSYIGPHLLARTFADVADVARTGRLPALLNVAAPACVQMGDLLDAAGLNWTGRPAGAATIPSVHLDISRLRLFTEFKASDCTPVGIVEDWQNRQA